MSEAKARRQPRRDGDSFTIDEWCASRRICRAMFYKLKAQGKAPRTYQVGSNLRISAEADVEWIRAREADAAAKSAAQAAA